MKNKTTTAQVFEAVEKGDTETVKEFIDQKENWREEKQSRKTLFQVAVEAGQVEVVEMLLNKGADVNAVLSKGPTNSYHQAIHTAVQNGDIKMVELLISKGATLDIKNNMNLTPLMLAANSGNKEIVEKLVSAGANPNIKGLYGRTAFYKAVEDNEIEIIEALAKSEHLDKGVLSGELGRVLDNKITYFENFDANKDAIIQTIKVLVAAGADANTRSIYGETTLHLAAEVGDQSAIEMLTQHGADVKAKNIHDKTASQILVEKQRENKLNSQAPHAVKESKVVKKDSAPVQAPSESEMSLHKAAKEGKIDQVEKMIKNGADVNAKDKSGKTVLDILLDQRRKQSYIENMDAFNKRDEIIETMLKQSSENLTYGKAYHNAGLKSVVKLAVNKLLNSVGIKTNVEFAYNKDKASVNLKFSKSSKAAVVEPNPETVTNASEVAKEAMEGISKEESRSADRGQSRQ